MEEESRSIRILKIIRQIGSFIRQSAENEYKEMNLTGSQGMIVGTLAHTGKMKIGDLSEKMGLSNSTVSGIIDRLEKQGYVERIRSKEDRRVVYVYATSQFMKRFKDHFNAIEKKMDTIMNEATLEEVEKIQEGFETLKKLLDRMSGSED